MNPIKICGCYELPKNSELRESTGSNFLWVNSSYGTSFSCFFFSVMPAEHGMMACLCQDQLDIAREELQAIVDFTIEKHGDCLDLRLKKSGDYQVRAGHNNAVLENSTQLLSGEISMRREIPSVRDLVFQGSLDNRTQISSGQFVE